MQESLQSFHEQFSKSCFQQAWELIETENRSFDDDLQMITLAHASLFHWSRRDDVTQTNLAVANWLLSRIYCLVDDADRALEYAYRSQELSVSLAAFYRGYAKEAVGRALNLAGEREASRREIELARQIAETIEDVDDRVMLLTDLETIH